MITENNPVHKSRGSTMVVGEDVKIELGGHSLTAYISPNHPSGKMKSFMV